MKLKKLIYCATIVLALLLVACKDTTEENVRNSFEEGGTEETSVDVDNEDTEDQDVDNEDTEDQVVDPDVGDTTTKEINQVVSDNNNAKITLINMTKVTDVNKGNVYEILFEIENRLGTMNMGLFVHGEVLANGHKLSNGQVNIGYRLDHGFRGSDFVVIYPQGKAYVSISIYADKEPKLPELNSFVMNLEIAESDPNYFNDFYQEHFAIDVTFSQTEKSHIISFTKTQSRGSQFPNR